jgi:hypothetical protein
MPGVVESSVFLIALLQAFPAVAANVNVNLPGSYSPTSPVGIVGNFYQFALMIGGLLAFGAIVWGGIRYATAAGNPGGQSDARDQVTQALLGLLLLVGAFLVLRTISPGLTTVSLRGLEDITVPAGQGSVSPCGGTTYGSCPPGTGTCARGADGNYSCRRAVVAFGLSCRRQGAPEAPGNYICASMPGCADVSQCAPGTCAVYPGICPVETN